MAVSKRQGEARGRTALRAESMTEDRGQNTFRPDLHPNPDTRTRDLMAETWDLKVFLPPANHPVSGFPFR